MAPDMDIVLANFWHLLVMAVLLGGIMFFSAAETAFLNLTRRQIETFSKSTHHIAKLIPAILHDPKNLLAGLLLGNMLVGTLFFAFSSVIIFSLDKNYGHTPAAIFAFVTLTVVVIFGEMMPKSIAYANSPLFARLCVLPCIFCLKILAPFRVILTALIVGPALKLILGSRPHVQPITVNQFRFLVDSSRQLGLIGPDENQLLGEIIDFGILKVRNIMRPRVDIIAIAADSTIAAARSLMKQHNISELPVYQDSIDNIIGIVDLPSLLLEPNNTIVTLLKPANYVPEQKTVESLLEHFRKSRSETAVVVDEYGQIAGTISQQDLLEELVGPAIPAVAVVQQIGPMSYRLAGDLAIHDWAAAFDIDTTQIRLSTIAGLVTTMLGKIPQPGDQARLRNLLFTVEKVHRHRIESLILNLEPIEPPSKKEGEQ